MYPIIAIVGRPNVGKSTIFNRLARERHAVISNVAGTTRDRICKFVKLHDYNVMLVDTGGIDSDTKEGTIESNVQKQAEMAINEADLVYYVLNAKEPLTREDYHAADILRKSHKKCFIIANKCDNKNLIEQSIELYQLGFGEPIFISALNNYGIDDLIDRTIKVFQKEGFKLSKRKEIDDKDLINICFLGTPNVGKSSLVNALCGEEKVIVSEIPGTTRDAIDIKINFEDKKINLIDTAGIRRISRIDRGIEKFSVLRSLQAIKRADICFLIIDANNNISNQDQHLAGYILKEHKGLVLVINKIDLIKETEKNKEKILLNLRKNFSFLGWAPVVFVSAKTKKNLPKLLEIAIQIKNERIKHIPTSVLNLFLKKIMMKHLPTGKKGKSGMPPKIYYFSQEKNINFPHFTAMVNDPEKFHFSYKRFLENEIRKEFGFTGTAIKIIYERNKKFI